MKIISRYVLKEHVGPFLFAATALTSIMLLQYIARRFGDLVGKGLPWQMIAEFFVLSIPFTVAMTLPMGMLVAVLYAFSRLASENEINALRAGGVSTRRLLVPSFVAGLLLAIGMLAFNDQVLPRSNHQLATLQIDIFRAKPTFALREQVINTVKEGQLYLRAGRLDPGSARMKDVVIYDLSDPSRRRTIYADSGMLAFAKNQRDLELTLYHGVMQSAPTETPGELTRLFYNRNRMVVQGVGSGPVTQSKADTTTKGDREMSVCEMQQQLVRYSAQEQQARNEMRSAEWAMRNLGRANKAPEPKPQPIVAAGGIGKLYCSFIATVFGPKGVGRLFGTKQAQAAELEGRGAMGEGREEPGTGDGGRGTAVGEQPVARAPGAQAPVPRRRSPVPVSQAPHAPSPSAGAAPKYGPPPSAGVGQDPAEAGIRQTQAKAQLEEARTQRNRYAVEIQKKFSLAAACMVFVLVGAPVAVRFPRGGVGLVIGVSFLIFALYYVGLIGGEALADRDLLSPFWAMWAANIVFTLVSIPMVIKMGTESNTGRGGGEWLDRWRAFRERLGQRLRGERVEREETYA